MADFKLGGVVYAHADGKVTLRPRIQGGQQKTFLSAKSFEGDANVEAFLLEGTAGQAVAIGVAMSKPDWKIELSNFEEILQYAKLCGPGYQRMHHDVGISFTQGARTATVAIGNCVIEKGWGLKSETSGGPGTSMSGKALTLDLDGVSGQPQLGVSGGGGGFAIGASISIGGLSLGVGLSL